jgi:hypothetical protein
MIMRNTYKKHDDFSFAIVIDSPKHGVFYILIDKEEYKICRKHCWRISYNKQTGRCSIITDIKENGIKKTMYLSRFLLNAPKGLVVDHINHDIFDNRKQNLRICTYKVNMENQKGPHKDRKHILPRNVRKNGNGFSVKIQHNKKDYNLGTFKDVKTAELEANFWRDIIFSL